MSEDDLIQLLADTLDRCKGEVEVVKEACSALRVLTFDDDIRVPFGKAHDHAKMIVTEAGALGRIMEMCKGWYIETGGGGGVLQIICPYLHRGARAKSESKKFNILKR